MCGKDQYHREIEARADLDPKYVVQILATGGEPGQLSDVQVLSDFKAEAGRLSSDGPITYGEYGIVMLEANRNLSVISQQEKLSPDQVQTAVLQIAECCHHLHEVGGRIHGDLKPLNIVRVHSSPGDEDTADRYKLIDMDASVPFGDPVGSCHGGEPVSTAYAAPELVCKQK